MRMVLRVWTSQWGLYREWGHLNEDGTGSEDISMRMILRVRTSQWGWYREWGFLNEDGTESEDISMRMVQGVRTSQWGWLHFSMDFSHWIWTIEFFLSRLISTMRPSTKHTSYCSCEFFNHAIIGWCHVTVLIVLYGCYCVCILRLVLCGIAMWVLLWVCDRSDYLPYYLLSYVGFHLHNCHVTVMLFAVHLCVSRLLYICVSDICCISVCLSFAVCLCVCHLL